MDNASVDCRWFKELGNKLSLRACPWALELCCRNDRHNSPVERAVRALTAHCNHRVDRSEEYRKLLTDHIGIIEGYGHTDADEARAAAMLIRAANFNPMSVHNILKYAPTVYRVQLISKPVAELMTVYRLRMRNAEQVTVDCVNEYEFEALQYMALMKYNSITDEEWLYNTCGRANHSTLRSQFTYERLESGHDPGRLVLAADTFVDECEWDMLITLIYALIGHRRYDGIHEKIVQSLSNGAQKHDGADFDMYVSEPLRNALAALRRGNWNM